MLRTKASARKEPTEVNFMLPHRKPKKIKTSILTVFWCSCMIKKDQGDNDVRPALTTAIKSIELIKLVCGAVRGYRNCRLTN